MREHTVSANRKPIFGQPFEGMSLDDIRACGVRWIARLNKSPITWRAEQQTTIYPDESAVIARQGAA